MLVSAVNTKLRRGDAVRGPAGHAYSVPIVRITSRMVAMTPYPLSLQLGMKRFHGHVFLAPGKLYFVCSKQGGAWAAAIGQGLGGAIGGAIAGFAQPMAGQAPPVIDEAQLQQAVAQNAGSVIMDATKIERRSKRRSGGG